VVLQEHQVQVVLQELLGFIRFIRKLTGTSGSSQVPQVHLEVQELLVHQALVVLQELQWLKRFIWN
jgi:hypothetical protein